MGEQLLSIALVAHDGMKDSLIEWAIFNRKVLAKCRKIWSTATTGERLREVLGSELNVETVLSGPLGGDMEIGALVARKKVDLLVFFIDPHDTHPHLFDIYALLRVAMSAKVPVACSRCEADIMITSPMLGLTET